MHWLVFIKDDDAAKAFHPELILAKIHRQAQAPHLHFTSIHRNDLPSQLVAALISLEHWPFYTEYADICEHITCRSSPHATHDL